MILCNSRSVFSLLFRKKILFVPAVIIGNKEKL